MCEYPVEPIKIEKGMTCEKLVSQFAKSGAFGAGRIAEATSILEKMGRDKDCRTFFGLAGAMVPAGMKKIVIDMMEDGLIDVFVTTGANITHDLIEAFGGKHLHGFKEKTDVELHELGINRIYDIYMKNEVYSILEKNLYPILESLPQKEMSITQFLRELGERVPFGILKTAADLDIPVFCPAIGDCGTGVQISIFQQSHDLKVDVFSDVRELVNLAWDAKKSGAILIGGGVPKNHIIQAMQFCDNEHAYAIQITMDRQETGGLSGASLSEAVSWGKLGEKAETVTVPMDATVALPLIYAAAKSRLSI